MVVREDNSAAPFVGLALKAALVEVFRLKFEFCLSGVYVSREFLLIDNPAVAVYMEQILVVPRFYAANLLVQQAFLEAQEFLLWEDGQVGVWLLYEVWVSMLLSHSKLRYLFSILSEMGAPSRVLETSFG